MVNFIERELVDLYFYICHKCYGLFHGGPELDGAVRGDDLHTRGGPFHGDIEFCG